MIIFIKKNKQSKEPITRKISSHSLQRKWADKLHKLTSKWSNSQKIMLLACTYLLIGGSSIYCLVNIGGDKNALQDIFKTGVPKQYRYPSLQLPQTFQIQIDSQLLDQFNRKYDSLIQTDSGRKQLEKFRKTRPGFLDSIKNASSLFNHFIIP